jgi:superfamily II DNA or RNA helicase
LLFDNGVPVGAETKQQKVELREIGQWSAQLLLQLSEDMTAFMRSTLVEQEGKESVRLTRLLNLVSFTQPENVGQDQVLSSAGGFPALQSVMNQISSRRMRALVQVLHKAFDAAAFEEILPSLATCLYLRLSCMPRAEDLSKVLSAESNSLQYDASVGAFFVYVQTGKNTIVRKTTYCLDFETAYMLTTINALFGLPALTDEQRHSFRDMANNKTTELAGRQMSTTFLRLAMSNVFEKRPLPSALSNLLARQANSSESSRVVSGALNHSLITQSSSYYAANSQDECDLYFVAERDRHFRSCCGTEDHVIQRIGLDSYFKATVRRNWRQLCYQQSKSALNSCVDAITRHLVEAKQKVMSQSLLNEYAVVLANCLHSTTKPHEKCAVFALPCGYGKTSLVALHAMLAAKSSPNTDNESVFVLLIVPTRAIATAIANHYFLARPFHQATSSMFPRVRVSQLNRDDHGSAIINPNLVIVTPQYLDMRRNYIKENAHRMLAVYFDEAHVVTTAVSGRDEFKRQTVLAYRHIAQDLEKHAPDAPIRGLSGSLSARALHKLLRPVAQGGLYSGQALVVRPVLSLPTNVRLSMTRLDIPSDAKQQLLDDVASLSRNAVALIIVMQRKEAETLAAWLQQELIGAIGADDSESDNDDDDIVDTMSFHVYFAHSTKLEGITELIRDRKTHAGKNHAFVLVATTVAGAGITIDGLNTVILYRAAYSMESIVQSIGRSGRTGDEASWHFVAHLGGCSDTLVAAFVREGHRSCMRKSVEAWMDPSSSNV